MAEFNKTLQGLIQKNSVEEARLLLQESCCVLLTDTVTKAVQSGHLELVKCFYDYHRHEKPRGTASLEADFLEACSYGHPDLVDFFIERFNANVNAVESPGNGQRTGLQLACLNNHNECIRLLVAHPSINVNKAMLGRPPVNALVYFGNCQGLCYLLASDHVVNLEVVYEHMHVMELASSILDCSPKKYNVAEMCARAKGNAPAIIQLLEAYKTDPNATRLELRKNIEAEERQKCIRAVFPAKFQLPTTYALGHVVADRESKRKHADSASPSSPKRLALESTTTTTTINNRCQRCAQPTKTVLACLHPLCARCAPEDLKICLDCHAPIATTTEQPLLIEMPQQQQSADPDPNHLICDVCSEKDALHYCRDCDSKLCQSCQDSHASFFSKKMKQEKTHSTTTIEEYLAQSKTSSQYLPCKLHLSRIADVLCESCRVVICSSCVVELHSEHKFMSMIDNPLTTVTSDIDNWQYWSSRARKEVMALLKESEANHQTSLENIQAWTQKTTETFDCAHARLEQFKQDLFDHVQQANKIATMQIDRFRFLYDELDGYFQSISSFRATLSPQELARIYHTVHVRLQTLYNTDCVEDPVPIIALPEPNLKQFTKPLDAWIP